MKPVPTRDDKINLILKMLMALMFVTGFLIFVYPFAVDSINNYVDQYRMEKTQKENQEKNKKQQEKLRKKMEVENAKRKQQVPGLGLVEDPFDEAVGNPNQPDRSYYEQHTIGSLFIPKIHVSLPVFDETNYQLLRKGATLLQRTSFPVGGKSTHAVITGHSGLPDKMLFTDLESLKKGDEFYLHIANKKLAYRIESFKTVEPTKLDELALQEGRDIVTLITCTPYMINSHRLLVTGVRVPYPKEAAKAVKKAQNYHKLRLILLMAGIIIFLVLFGYWVWRKVVFYQSKKRLYDLEVYLIDGGIPVPQQKVRLLVKKDPYLVKGKEVIAVSDEKGRLCFDQIPGNVYQLDFLEETAWPKTKAKIWRLKDHRFKILANRKYLMKNKNKGIYTLKKGKV